MILFLEITWSSNFRNVQCHLSGFFCRLFRSDKWPKNFVFVSFGVFGAQFPEFFLSFQKICLSFRKFILSFQKISQFSEKISIILKKNFKFSVYFGKKWLIFAKNDWKGLILLKFHQFSSKTCNFMQIFSWWKMLLFGKNFVFLSFADFLQFPQNLGSQFPKNFGKKSLIIYINFSH